MPSHVSTLPIMCSPSRSEAAQGRTNTEQRSLFKNNCNNELHSIQFHDQRRTTPVSISRGRNPRYRLLNSEAIDQTNRGIAQTSKRPKDNFDNQMILGLAIQRRALPLGWVYANSCTPALGSITSLFDTPPCYYQYIVIFVKILQRSSRHKRLVLFSAAW